MLTYAAPALVLLPALVVKEAPALAAELRAHADLAACRRCFERGVFEDSLLMVTAAHAPPDALAHIRGVRRW